jgi:hypothetical protein
MTDRTFLDAVSTGEDGYLRVEAVTELADRVGEM